jgi:PAS domain S-box-containing protein
VDQSPQHPALEEELQEALVQQTRDLAIVRLDAQGRIASWNAGAERMLGYAAEQVQGRHFSIFFTPEDVTAARPELELQHAAQHGSYAEETWLVRGDGRRFYDSGITTRLAGEPLRGFTRIFRDRTDRKRLEEEAQRRRRDLTLSAQRTDEFLAMLAHELRGPLAPINNALQVLRRDPPRGPAGEQARRILERQVQHMARLVDDLVDVARASRGKMELKRERRDLNEILTRAVQSARSYVESRQHQLVVDCPRRAVWVHADPVRIEQAVDNLLTNAARYTLPGGRIWLSAVQHHDRVRISVRDNGIGIAPELLPAVFEVFVQGERTPDRSQGGLGIGLTLVRKIAELHGGCVSAHSAGVGKGAEFVIELPAEPVVAHEEPGQRVDHETPKVLVVDDSVDTADSLAMLLSLDGYEVRTAHDGIAALSAAREFAPEVVLMDIGLPGADGYEVAQRIRGEESLHDVLLIAMTGYGEEEARARSRQAGFDHHLVKPVDVSELKALLAPRVARRGQPGQHRGAH